MSEFIATQLPLAPLGAGDLIDRAVRLYRRHLFTLMRIAAPPVVVTAIGSILWTIGWRQLFVTPSNTVLAFYILLFSSGAALIIIGHIFSMLVMGGATRNLVTHLLWNEPVSARTTYSAVRSRFWALLGATLIVALWGGISVSIALFGWYMVLIIIGLGAVVLAQVTFFWLSALLGVIAFLAATVVALWLFFFMVSRVAYVPQVMLVEASAFSQRWAEAFR